MIRKKNPAGDASVICGKIILTRARDYRQKLV